VVTTYLLRHPYFVGWRMEIDMATLRECPLCKGRRSCPECDGLGEHPCSACVGDNESCPTCDGTGAEPCLHCKGQGICPRCRGEGEITH
jgi:DnaJ-class molecular chaperone